MANMVSNVLNITVAGSDDELDWQESLELQDSAAGVIRSGCGGLLPVPDEPTAAEQEEWFKILSAKFRQDHGDQDVDRQERHWRQYIGDLHHDWRVYKTWGCSNIMLEQRKLTISRRELEFWFQTKSSPPHKWVLAIAERHPQWHITLTAFDAEAGAWNYTLASDGKEWTQARVAQPNRNETTHSLPPPPLESSDMSRQSRKFRFPAK